MKIYVIQFGKYSYIVRPQVLYKAADINCNFHDP